MTVADIQAVTVDNVNIYIEHADFNFEDLYAGNAIFIPEALLHAQVESVNAVGNYTLNIRIARGKYLP